nr:scavenger receptor cysteine-rich domain superfamily protein-like [Lytechinus pictus]
MVPGCESETVEWDIRLRDGGSSSRGRVEVYLDGMWGSICAAEDAFLYRTSRIVCGTLGLNSTNVREYTTDRTVLGDIRLVNGSTSDEGRVEIFIGGEWGTICDDGWDDNDAFVVSTVEGDVRLVGTDNYSGRLEYFHNDEWGTICRGYFDDWNDVNAWVVCFQLGFKPFSGFSEQWSSYGNPPAPIHLNNVGCSGKETRLESCQSDLSGVGCSHFSAVWIHCHLPSDGDIRLQGGTLTIEGRVETFYRGRWGSVCASNWGATEAWVVCQQLGFKPRTGFAVSGAGYTSGIDRMHLNNVSCQGQEYHIDECVSNNVFELGSCGDDGYAAVYCPLDLQDGDVRLVNGVGPNEGRVEIFYGGEWGSVCDDRWDDVDAQVVCRQLGYRTDGAAATTVASFGRGSDAIHLDEVECSGIEARMEDCSRNGWGVNDCTHYEDAGVVCSVHREGDVRLAGGATTNKGRVEIYTNGQWGVVCNHMSLSWTDTDAAIVCRQLGMYKNDSGEVIDSIADQRVGPVHITDLNCDGTEKRLDECRSSSNNATYCATSDVAMARCISPMEGAVRLVGGSSLDEGRVEIFHDVRWGRVCATSIWSVAEARVVCRQLGYNGNEAAVSYAFGIGSGPIYLDYVTCSSSEDRLEDCDHLGLGIVPISARIDAGVQCILPATEQPLVFTVDEIRLNGSSSENEGRLEVFTNGRWGTVCGNNQLYVQESMAEVVCRQLGFSDQEPEAIGSAFYGSGTGPIWLRRIYCVGTESDLNSCILYSWSSGSCTSSEVVSIRCQNRASNYPRVVGTIAFIGVSLSLLTLASFVAVCYTCTNAKPVKLVEGTRQGNILGETSPTNEGTEVTSSF